MEYTNLIHDFAVRTLRNLDHVVAQNNEGVEGVYPVTQLWNSLLGLVVAPHEAQLKLIPSTPMEQLRRAGWPGFTTEIGDEPETLDQLIRYLRNAVAHFNVEFKAPSKGEISAVTVWNRELRGRREIIWRGRMSVGDLEALARQVAQLYIHHFSAAAA